MNQTTNRKGVGFCSIAIFASLFALAFAGAASAQETRWVGVYACGPQQGVTGLTLTITQAPDNQLTAVADFYPNPTNPELAKDPLFGNAL
jgi:hypothetical protein